MAGAAKSQTKAYIEVNKNFPGSALGYIYNYENHTSFLEDKFVKIRVLSTLKCKSELVLCRPGTWPGRSKIDQKL